MWWERTMKRHTRWMAMVIATLALTGAVERWHPVPPPRPVPVPPIMPMIAGLQPLSLEVDANVDGVRISATCSLRFRNMLGVPAEGTILFPVPEGVSVERFTMRVGEEVIGGELLTADEARRIYEEIVRRRRDPAILSLVGDSALSVRVFPVPPGEERTLEVRWSGLLEREREESRIRLPLKTSLESVSERIAVRVDIRTDEPLTTLYSPVEGVSVVRDTSRSAVLRWEAEGLRAPYEWTAVFGTTRAPVGISIIPFREFGDDGYALVLISPGLPDDDRRSPKNFILVADTSGSMAGEKIRNLKDGARYILNNLRAGDRFNVIAFEAQLRVFESAPAPATSATIERALDFVERLEAAGGTNIHEALVRALSLPRPARMPTYIVFITDGLPTIGVQTPDAILNAVAQHQKHDSARIFVLGVGLDVNVALLDRIARENSGSSEYVRNGPELEQKMSDLYRKLQAPVITNARLNVSGVRAYDMYPAESFDLFAGSQTVVALRYSGAGHAQVTVSGVFRERAFRVSRGAQFPARSSANPYVARVWATRKIGALLDEIRLKGGPRELIDSVIHLSRKYGIMTAYTDFLILEPGMRPEEARGRFLGGGGFGSGSPGSLAPPPSPDAAAKAQEASQDFARLAQSETTGAGDRNLKVCAARSFIFRNDRWEEPAFAEALRADPELKPKKVVFLSDEYFKLVDANPDLKECFATATRLVLKIGDAWYEITDEKTAGDK
jgi:Ca-activated chloride channel family protein